MHFYFLSIFVSLKKPLCEGRCSAEPKVLLYFKYNTISTTIDRIKILLLNLN